MSKDTDYDLTTETKKGLSETINPTKDPLGLDPKLVLTLLCWCPANEGNRLTQNLTIRGT